MIRLIDEIDSKWIVHTHGSSHGSIGAKVAYEVKI